MTLAYYNDSDRGCQEWLRNLVERRLVSWGKVDGRSVADVAAGDLDFGWQYDRVHLFAGIGGWDYALALAGWPAGRRIWTGSCPCQPFSQAGRQQGTDDKRHLWPEMLRLIAECHPPIVVGEQVASALGRAWLSAVRLDLENLGYAVGAADLCAASVGAPHIRQRLFWVAVADGERFDGFDPSVLGRRAREIGNEAAGCGEAGGGGTAAADFRSGRPVGESPEPRAPSPEHGSREDRACGLAGADSQRCGERLADIQAARNELHEPRRGETSRLADEQGSGWAEGGVPCGASGQDGPRLADGERLGDCDIARLEGCRPDIRLGCQNAGGVGEEESSGPASPNRELGDPGSAGGGGDAGAVLGAQREGHRERFGARYLADELIPSGILGGSWAECDWLMCRDGKARPVEPGAQSMVDGISFGMGLLRSNFKRFQEISDAAKADRIAEQILRALRDGHDEEEIWNSMGSHTGISEASILLAVVLEQSRELGEIFIGTEKSGAQEHEAAMRTLRVRTSTLACPSQGRKPSQQLAWEFGNTLSALPSVRSFIRQHQDNFSGFPLAESSPGRVGRLRGYGNAIVPELAAAFVASVMDALGITAECPKGMARKLR